MPPNAAASRFLPGDASESPRAAFSPLLGYTYGYIGRFHFMYDAIVVGARCAGSPVAMLLARKGYKVLVVDKGSFPSDIMSTHYIHQVGAAKLKRWGLLDQVAASNCPPMTEMRFDVGPFALTG